MENIPTAFQDLITDFVTFIPNLIAALVIFVVSIYLAGVINKLLKRTLERRKTDAEFTLLILTVTRWSVIALGLVMSLQQIGFNLSAFLAGLGILGFTIGFALQDVSKNFVAGLLLLLQQPFDMGDSIEVNGYTGTVLDVNLRATELRTFDGKHVLIPNADVFTSAITNFNRETNRRLDLTVGVAYGSDLEFVRKTALDAISPISGVIPDPAPEVIFNSFADSTINFTLYYWVDTAQLGLLAAQDAVLMAINSAFEQKGIEMPFPTQVVHLQK